MAKKKHADPPTELLPRNRNMEIRRVRVADLEDAPWNFRTHGEQQTATLDGAIEELGFHGYPDVYVTAEGKLRLYDGHLRKQLLLQKYGPDAEIDVNVTDFDDAEAKKAMLTKDPIAAMAGHAEDKLHELIASVSTENDALEQLMDDLAGKNDDKPGNPDEQDIALHYSVLIRCQDEKEQLAILTELEKHNLDTKAICAGLPKAEPKAPAPAPKVEAKGRVIKRETEIKRTARVKQMEGMFDVPPSKRQQHEWTIDFELDRPWSIGLIVGPSGSGKTTLARELFAKELVTGWPWPADKSVLDGFPADMPIHEITGLLSSVGFSSPPNWLKPFHVLSNGEQFRVTLARTLAEAPELAVVDEFTSVVDRTVAQIGSAALAKTIRASGRRFVAVACHYDIEDWLQPDWKYDTASGQFLWRSLRRRPEISLRIRRVDASHWKIFAHHHYLSHSLHRAAKCFVGEVNGRPACFASVIHNPHKGSGWWREHRTVCLPDFQGVGIGNALSNFVASVMVATGKQYRSTTTHPAMIQYRNKSRLWEMIRAPELSSPPSGSYTPSQASAWDRPSAGFRYIGPINHAAAEALGVLKLKTPPKS
jgi:ABC-type molybdenum transport system ATPase subunit/photorepair protein PhrA